jgi:hypothetical protein
LTPPENPYQPPRAPLESEQSAQARDLRRAGKYLLVATIVGFLELIDASTLASNAGVFGPLNYLVSIVELFWLFASILVLIRVKQPTTKLVAHAFVAYAVIGMIVGASIGSSESAPMPVVVVGGVFGLSYAIASAYVGASRVWRKAPSQ